MANNSPQAARMVQRQSMADNRVAKPAIQKADTNTNNNTGLPDNLKSGMESLSGINLNHVKVHYNSAKPAAVQAHAYAQGHEIHLGAGQEKHLPHELGHVVQQAQGRVNLTSTVGGMAINDNAGLEKEADVLGAKALQMQPKENKSRSIVNSTVRTKSNLKQCFGFVDNRPATLGRENAIIQRVNYTPGGLANLLDALKIEADQQHLEIPELIKEQNTQGLKGIFTQTHIYPIFKKLETDSAIRKQMDVQAAVKLLLPALSGVFRKGPEEDLHKDPDANGLFNQYLKHKVPETKKSKMAEKLKIETSVKPYVCRGHGTYFNSDKTFTVPVGIVSRFSCPDTKRAAGGTDELEYLAAETVEGGGQCNDYRLWPLEEHWEQYAQSLENENQANNFVGLTGTDEDSVQDNKTN
ncbi:eCIS core domain-containing protein [Shewanella surugensis]|uniref:DUF4157 domain-containing protein n=1 Tax=Shewanella surugensis TaxID=212020 RepID=A0ABT0L7I6_9GAMM|nr:DUF4157 domain-containing protein [Shewanella surugensis]MCL1123355.1 DUF4157 domain-containing protein [Shewanella surugensis]